jgi:hypothetical protein
MQTPRSPESYLLYTEHGYNIQFKVCQVVLFVIIISLTTSVRIDIDKK